MDYLKVSRQASEGRRAARLSRGLSCFVEGSSSFVDGHYHSRASSSAPQPSPPTSAVNLRASPPDVSRATCTDGRSRRSRSADERSFSSLSDGKLDTGTSSDLVTPFSDLEAGNSRKSISPDESSWLFRRAANLLRESLELSGDGGVVFLDANGSSSDSPSTDIKGPAPVLAVSTNDDPFAPKAGSTVSYPVANMDRSFLGKLLRRYPKGKLWSFHRDGSLSTSDDDDSHRKDVLYHVTRSVEPPKLGGGCRKWKATETAMLNRYFPNASQLLFVPLWNAAGSQWFAGCFCWNTVETQVFSSAVELSSVMGFGTSIMAEWSRVKSLIADRQKGDFIGCISHELRSPLHGILAATELMDGTSLNEFQDSLLQTVNACGRTLLDTVNQVLDYSKIVSLGKNWRHLRRSRELPSEKADNSGLQLDESVYTDVAVLTEEVVEGVCLGHRYGDRPCLSLSDNQPVSSPAGNKRRPICNVSSIGDDIKSDVEVVIDIAYHDWIYKTQPGALRRIVMNIFGNALKYTEKGRVTVKLEMAESPKSPDSRPSSPRDVKEEWLTLTVSDTGKGISPEFLRGRLYTPFAQEDTLAVGTGLGLSIVRSIVKALNGTISIQSRPNGGTVVKVSLPLARRGGADSPPTGPQGSFARQTDTSAACLVRERFAGRSVAIWGVNPANLVAQPRWGVIAQYLRVWYGLELVAWSSSTPVDILVADGHDLPVNWKDDDSLPETLPALLVLCNRCVDTTKFHLSPVASSINVLCNPCGPNKLANGILKCLKEQKADVQPISLSSLQLCTLPERPKDSDVIADDKSAACNVLELLSERNSESDRDGSASQTPPSSVDATAKSESTESFLTEPATSSASTPSPWRSPSPTLEYPSAQPRTLQPPRVLVVDDNAINRNLMLTFMKRHDHLALDSAEDGKSAVEEVERMRPGYDIIFMDISMPVMDGFEATRAIRSLEKERDCCSPAFIIALTGLSSSADQSEALASGIDLFLTKPVSFKEVSRLLKEWAVKRGTSQR
ncbi:hypothetical protein MAP00_008311 [Monascus purpureus]|nr:hypothetical protein MAP00_008311 [Monascus purpureus]